MSYLKGLGLGAVCLFSVSGYAAPLQVVTTLKPIALIVEAVAQGKVNNQVLLPTGASPHDYALRPSDIEKMKNADLVIWTGPELETFLTKTLSANSNSFALMAQSNIHFMPYGEEKEEQHEHEHEHEHGRINPHFWLGAEQAIQAAQAIANQLIQKDPENKAHYQQNVAAFVQDMTKLQVEMKQDLGPLQTQGYFVFHDAYDYFEHPLQLNQLGHFTVDPDRRPGAKTLLNIRKALKEEKAVCVFSEPQFSPAVIETVTKGSQVNIGVLDPMATEISITKDGYILFLKEISNSFSQCLTSEKRA